MEDGVYTGNARLAFLRMVALMLAKMLLCNLRSSVELWGAVVIINWRRVTMEELGLISKTHDYSFY